jgi:hypothetical protein
MYSLMPLESFDGIQMHVFYKVVMSKVYKYHLSL